MSLCLKEIVTKIESINKRRKNDIEFRASLHGVKLKEDKPEETKQIELDENQKTAMERALKDAMERKAKQYGR